MSIQDPDGGRPAQKYNSGLLSSQWTLAQVLGSTPATARIDLDVLVEGNPGDCYLVDDLALIAE
jgi:hypothetical protein